MNYEKILLFFRVYVNFMAFHIFVLYYNIDNLKFLLSSFPRSFKVQEKIRFLLKREEAYFH